MQTNNLYEYTEGGEMLHTIGNMSFGVGQT